MLSVRKLSKRIDGHPILKSIDLDVAAGDVVALIGPSGAGKTTLLRCLNLLERPDAGTLTIAGLTVDVASMSRRDELEVRRRTAMVFQSYNLFKNRTALDNVALGLHVVKGVSWTDARARAMAELERVGMADHADRYPRQLSGGQQQRVGIARSLALDPDVLLLDEPTASLDPELSAGVLALVREVAADGMTMVIATHEMRFARTVSTNVVVLEAGTIVEQGPPASVFEREGEDRISRFVSGGQELISNREKEE